MSPEASLVSWFLLFDCPPIQRLPLVLRTEVCILLMQSFPPAPCITLQCLWGGAKPSLQSWDLSAVVTANSILSPAQSAGSACASEVEAVSSGATVGQTGTGEGGGGWGGQRVQSCHSKGRIPPGNEGGEECKSL